MPRWQTYGGKDTVWVQDGDPGWRGVDMIHDRALLRPGYLARSENKRLRDGPASTRPGTSFVSDFNPGFENKILGSGIYSNPNGEEVMLVATLNATYVWALQWGKDPVQIDLSVGNTGTSPLGLVQFVQGFDKVILLRFPPATPLVWDGNNAHTFDPIALVPPGLNLVPTHLFGVPHKNRVIYYSPYWPAYPVRDQVIISDINNYSSYDPVYGDVRINSGESDIITSVLPYFKDSIVVFKKRSIHMLENFTIPLSLGVGSGDQRLLTNKLGGTGVHPPLIVGTDAIFASEPGGYYRVSEVIQEQIATQPVPVSRRIQTWIDKIDWDRMIWWGCSALLNDYAYFGMTIKGTSGSGVVPGCDVIGVYNVVTDEWESIDYRADRNFLINALHVTNFAGARRLFGLDYANAAIYMLDEGIEDETNNDILPIHDVVETRGYTANDPSSFKRFMRGTVGIRSFAPQATVTAISDGVNEQKHVHDITKDRTRFYIHGRDRFNPLTDDPNQMKREDYSPGEDLDNFLCEDFEGLEVGPIDFLPALGTVTNPGQKQQCLERFFIRQNGRWVSLRIENVGGQCDVLGASVDAIPSSEGLRVVA